MGSLRFMYFVHVESALKADFVGGNFCYEKLREINGFNLNKTVEQKNEKNNKTLIKENPNISQRPFRAFLNGKSEPFSTKATKKKLKKNIFFK